jgi:hypothetical protein
MQKGNFWNQKSFWVWIVMAILCAFFAPIVAMIVYESLVARVMEIFNARTNQGISLGALIGMFSIILLVVYLRVRKYGRMMLLAEAVAVLLLVCYGTADVKGDVLKINGKAVFGLFWLLTEVFTVYLFILWGRENFVPCGTAEVPAQGALTRWGKFKGFVGPGGLIFIIRPFEGLRLFPTGQFKGEFRISEGLYSKAEGNESSQPLDAIMPIYLSIPRIGEQYTYREVGMDLTGNKTVRVVKVQGEILLEKIFHNLPVDDLSVQENVEELFGFLEGSVLGAARHVLSKKTSKQCREEKPQIEREMKTYLLEEPGNPFLVCGFPEECIDLELRVKIPNEMEQAYMAPEIAKKKAEASSEDKKVISRKMKAYIDEGTSPDVAAMAVSGAQGGGMTTEQLRDIALAASLLGGGQISLGGMRFKSRGQKPNRPNQPKRTP